MNDTIDFVKELLAIVTGNDAQARAMRRKRQCRLALKGQINALKSKRENLDMSLEDAEAKLRQVVLTVENGSMKEYNSETFSADYIENIKEAQKAVTLAKKNKDDNTKALELFEGLLKTYGAVAEGEEKED